MEERDVRASPRHDQSSLSAPHVTTLPSMHAPHLTTQHHQQQQQHHHHPQHQQSQSYTSSQHAPEYAASSTPLQTQGQQQHHHQQRHYYDQRDGANAHSQHSQYDYNRQPSVSVALPPIQHLDASNTATGTSTMNNSDSSGSSGSNPNHATATTAANTSDSNNNTNISRQPTLPPPLPPQRPPQPTHTYPHEHTTNGDTRHPYQHHPPSAYAPQYAPNQYHQYQGANMHPHQPPPPAPQHLPHSAMMPSNMHGGHDPTLRYGLPPTLQLDPRQMSGGRHKKEIKRRTKTGCLTCRKRRIKCDERHPHCRNCEKSKRECLGYDPVFKSQPAPPALQPAPLPNQIPKSEPVYRYAYPNPEDVYAARPGPGPPPPHHSLPPPPPSTAIQPQGAPSVNGGYNDHNAGPLADGDHNRGLTHTHTASTDMSGKR